MTPAPERDWALTSTGDIGMILAHYTPFDFDFILEFQTLNHLARINEITNIRLLSTLQQSTIYHLLSISQLHHPYPSKSPPQKQTLLTRHFRHITVPVLKVAPIHVSPQPLQHFTIFDGKMQVPDPLLLGTVTHIARRKCTVYLLTYLLA